MTEASSSPPSDPASIIDSTVKIQNLVSKPELNSQLAIVKSYDLQSNRYRVQLCSSPPTSPPIALKADNLARASMVEKAKGQFEVSKTMMKFMMESPEVRNEFLRLYSLVDAKLPNGVKPEYAIGGIGLLLLLVVYFIGFSKAIVLFSLVAMLAIVALPDIMTVLSGSAATGAGPNALKVILRNFPSRWRNMIHDQSGRHLSPRIANGILIALLLFSAKVLLTPIGSNGSRVDTSKLTQTELDMTKQRQQMKKSGVSFTIEDIYKLGYKDATEKKDFGISLPKNYETFTFTELSSESSATSTTSTTFDDFEYDYQPSTPPLPPASTKESKLGVSTLFSMFALFRTVKELGFVNGGFDMNYFMANAQAMPPLKMAFVAFMVYRLVSAFM